MHPGVAGVVQPRSYNQTRRECTEDEGYRTPNNRNALRMKDTRRAKLEEKRTSKVKALSNVHRHQKEQQHNGEDMDKNDEGARAGQRDTSKEGGSTNRG